jgi:hypothetical protein
VEKQRLFVDKLTRKVVFIYGGDVFFMKKVVLMA